MTSATDRIVAALRKFGDMDRWQLSERAYVSVETLNGGFMQRLRRVKAIRISGWKQVGKGRPRAIFSATAGDNVPMPAGTSRRKKCDTTSTR